MSRFVFVVFWWLCRLIRRQSIGKLCFLFSDLSRNFQPRLFNSLYKHTSNMRHLYSNNYLYFALYFSYQTCQESLNWLFSTLRPTKLYKIMRVSFEQPSLNLNLSFWRHWRFQKRELNLLNPLLALLGNPLLRKQNYVFIWKVQAFSHQWCKKRMQA